MSAIPTRREYVNWDDFGREISNVLLIHFFFKFKSNSNQKSIFVILAFYLTFTLEKIINKWQNAQYT